MKASSTPRAPVGFLLEGGCFLANIAGFGRFLAKQSESLAATHLTQAAST